MSVPSTAYRAIPLTGVNNSGAVQHLRAILQVSDAYMKSTFFLDELFPCVDESGNLGVVGIVYPGTDNYDKHNESRHGSLRRVTDGVISNQDGIFLNDSLVTKGEIKSVQIVSVIGLTFKAVWKSAFYLPSTISLDWYVDEFGITTFSGTIDAGSIAENEEFGASNTYMPVPYPDPQNEATVYLRANITNSEGTVSSDYIAKAMAFSFNMDYAGSDGGNKPYNARTLYQSTKTVYSNRPKLASGASIYKDELMTVLADSGSYKYYDTVANRWNFLYVASGASIQLSGPCPDVVYLNFSVFVDLETEVVLLIEAKNDAGFPVNVNTNISFNIEVNIYDASTDTTTPISATGTLGIGQNEQSYQVVIIDGADGGSASLGSFDAQISPEFYSDGTTSYIYVPQ